MMASGKPRAGFALDRRALLGAGAGAVALSAFSASAQTPSPIVATKAGRVRGYVDPETGVLVFKGIRYGADTAAYRFQAPRPPQPWSDVADCTRFGNRAAQGPEGGIAETAITLGKEAPSEDCLFLNVWTPAATGKRPVVIYFHGGGFAGGSGSMTWFEGERLARKQDLVVVTINHRLNVFGFLHLADLDPRFADSGMVGMLDCVQSLQWLKDNIARFGGDPDNVTIFGQSGGAAKVCTLMGMPGAAGLFHRSLAMSGNALRSTSPADATAATKRFMKNLSLAETEVDKLVALPADKLIRTAWAGAGGGPVTGSAHYPRPTFTGELPAFSANVPLILGSTATEVTFFAITPLDPIDEVSLVERLREYTGQSEAEVKDLLVLYRKTRPTVDTAHLYQTIATDWMLTIDQQTVAARKAAQGKAPAYVYQMHKLTSVRAGKLRSPHCIDVPYFFDNLKKGVLLTGPGNQVLADKMSATLAAFARTGDPNNAAIPRWDAFSPDRRTVMIFDDKVEAQVDPRSAERLAITALKTRPPVART